jgi:parallel beta-helix repeat protein
VGVSAVVTVTVANGGQTASCSGVSVSPGQNLQAAVDGSPGGTTFCLRAGVHRLAAAIVPKAGDGFVGDPGAVVSGAKDITGLFVFSGGVWVASGQTQRNPVTYGVCNPGFDLCASAEDVFFDNSPLLRVGSLAQLGPGKFFFDYGSQRIYIADNPSGHTVEAAVATRAFRGWQTNATFVTIRGLVIEKFANEAGVGAINANAGWVIENNEVRLNHGIGIQGGSVIRNNKVHHNGQLGLSVYGDSDVLVENNELAFNNYAGFGTSWEAGGGKFMRTTRLTVRGNYIHDNLGVGIGSDSDNLDTVYEYNRIEDNAGTGIVVEVSYATLIRGNTISRNGFAFTGGLAGAGVYINTSQDVEISGNTIDRNFQGIGIFSTDRGSGPYGTYVTKNNYVHDNTLILRDQSATGLTSYAVADYTSNNNRFQNNHYIMCGTAWFAVSAGNGAYTYTNAAGWVAAGNDTTGTFAYGC